MSEFTIDIPAEHVDFVRNQLITRLTAVAEDLSRLDPDEVTQAELDEAAGAVKAMADAVDQVGWYGSEGISLALRASDHEGWLTGASEWASDSVTWKVGEDPKQARVWLDRAEWLWHELGRLADAVPA